MALNLVNLVLFIIYILILWTISQALYVLIRRKTEKTWPKRKAKGRAKIIQYSVLLVGLAIGMNMFLSLSLDELLVSMGLLSLAAAFFSKSIIENAMAGVQISTEKKIEVEDWVEIGSLDWKTPAKITDISLTKTTLRDIDGTEYIIANYDLNSSQVINYTKTGYAEVDVELPLPMTTRLEELEKIIVPIALAHPSVFPNVKYEAVLTNAGLAPGALKKVLVKNIDLSKLNPYVLMLSVKPNHLVFNLRCYVAEVRLVEQVRCDLTWAIWDELQARKMTL